MSDEAKNALARQERRSAQRIPAEMWVEETTDRELYFQRGANISVGGLFLERTIPHNLGTTVNLRFTLPDETKPISVKGEIVSVGDSDSDLGMGVKFLNLSDEDRQRIERFIARISDQKANG